MKKCFNQEMVDTINNSLQLLDCSFRYVLVKEDLSGNILSNPHIEIVPLSIKFIENYIFNLSKSYYEWLEKFCKDNFDITLSYNNSKNVIWSNEGW